MFLICFTTFLSTQQIPGNTSVRERNYSYWRHWKSICCHFWWTIDNDFGISLKSNYAAKRLRMPLLITSPPLIQKFQDLRHYDWQTCGGKWHLGMFLNMVIFLCVWQPQQQPSDEATLNVIKTESANTNRERQTHLCMQFNLLVSIPPFFPTRLHLGKYKICTKFGNSKSDTTKYKVACGWTASMYYV